MVTILLTVPMSVGKKKTYAEAHIGKELDSDDESSDSDSDGVATVAIKGFSSSSSKSLFPNLNKGNHTCLMAKKSKKKVKSKPSPPKYVYSDEELDLSDEEDEETLLNDMCKNPKERMKGLLKEVGIHDELLDQQEMLLVQEKESNQKLKKLLKLEREKNEKFDKKLAQSKETISSLKISSGSLQDSYNVLQKTHKDLEVQFDAIWSGTSNPSNNIEASTSQVRVEISDEEIAQGNDQLKLEVKRLEQLVSELVKQAKVRPPQDNCRNMVNKLEKGSNFTKRASQ
jgi:chromosome segregation ATPase